MLLKTESLPQVRQGMTAQSVHFLLLHLETRIISFKWLLCESCQWPWQAQLCTSSGDFGGVTELGTLKVEQILCCVNGGASFWWAPKVVSDLVRKWMEDLSLLFLFWSFTKGLYWYKSIGSFRIYTLKIGGRVWLAAFVLLLLGSWMWCL